MKKVIVIVGPTGSGKTDLSLKIAQQIKGEIINGDSVQVYQQLNIGSAKIKKDQMENIKHHLIDIKHPKENYSVFDFQKDARTCINNIKHPIIVGGTGLYIKAALYHYEFHETKRIHSFEAKYESFSTDTLYEMVLKSDPNYKIEHQNRRRVLRALEQIESGIIPSQLNQKDIPLYDMLILYLDMDKKILEQRLITRLENMLFEGFIEEVKNLRSQGILMNVIGYREINQYLEGNYDLNQAKDDIIKATKRLAKKQKTWFKNQESPVFLDALSQTLFEDAMDYVNQFLERGSNI